MRRVLGCAAAIAPLVLIVGGGAPIVAHADPPEGAGDATPARSAKPAAEGSAPSAPDAGLSSTDRSRVRRLIQQTSALRGLRVRRRLTVRQLSRKAIARHVATRLAQQHSPEEIARDTALLERLGLIPAGLDYRAAVLAVLEEQVAGFYDPATRRLNLARWIPLRLQEPALVHEVCHALQDQHFRLERLTRPIRTNSDRQLARAALIEGDCTGVMLEHTLRPSGQDLGSLPDAASRMARKALLARGSSALGRAPRYLRETLLFPYAHGLEMVRRIRSRHPWHTVSRMFRRPPVSTEQVLHPRKYWRRERPVAITPRPLPTLAGYQEIKRDVLGEFQLGLYLEGGVSPEVARRAAEGWAGDRVVAYRRKGKATAPLLVHLTTWDSPADALEYSNAQRRLLVKQGRRPMSDSVPGVHVYSDGEGEQWSVERHRRHVLVIHGAPREARRRLQDEVWKRFRMRGRRLRPPARPTPPAAPSSPPASATGAQPAR